jgi:hypothetical protein
MSESGMSSADDTGVQGRFPYLFHKVEHFTPISNPNMSWTSDTKIQKNSTSHLPKVEIDSPVSDSCVSSSDGIIYPLSTPSVQQVEIRLFFVTFDRDHQHFPHFCADSYCAWSPIRRSWSASLNNREPAQSHSLNLSESWGKSQYACVSRF